MNYNSNKIIIGIAIVSIFIALIIPVALNIHTKRIQREYKAMNLEVIEAAKKCVKEQVCTTNKIFVKTLYDNDYLTDVINPYTDKDLDENSYIKIEDDEYTLITIE